MAEQNGEPGDMVTCPTCGKIWPKGTRFCTLCGTWIQSGKVIDAATLPPPPPGGPGRTGIGSSPPGIAPVHAGLGTPQSGFDATPPGIGGPAQPGPGEEPPQGLGEGPPPPKKYAFKIEPPRQEHVPQGRMFIPEHAPKKKSGIKPTQIPIVIICLLVLAYVVVSVAFKPMHNYLLGLFFDKINRTESAIKHYQKVTTTYWSTSWAKPASKALARIGRHVFAAHLERQYYTSWTATSKITLTASDKPIELASTLAFKPGFFAEEITQGGRPVGKHLLNGTFFVQYLGSPRQGVSADAYAQQMQQLVGFRPDKLFAESGKQETLDAFFDKLELRFNGIEDDDLAGKVYVFSVTFSTDGNRRQQFGMLSSPFFDWCGAAHAQQIASVKCAIRVEDGFLARAEFMNSDGTTVVQQTFADFQTGLEIPDSRFAR
jgi:hypothetical protein